MLKSRDDDFWHYGLIASLSGHRDALFLPGINAKNRNASMDSTPTMLLASPTSRAFIVAGLRFSPTFPRR